MSTRRAPATLQRVLPRFAPLPGEDNEKAAVEYLTRLIAALQQTINDLSNPGTLRCGNLIVYDCLEPSPDLAVGDVYVDGAGYLRLRQAGSPVVSSLAAGGRVSSVTVSITP